MKIYKNEISLAEQIIKNNSVAYCASVQEDKAPIKRLSIAALASINCSPDDRDDLFYTRSVLVSTVKNLNDDVFVPSETWAARKTPIDKVTNLNHDPKQIIGHIVSQWAVDGDGNLIADNMEAALLPDLFHICTGAVIYKDSRDDEARERAAALIEQIAGGGMFVSMEAFFDDFDYLVTKGEEAHFITRSDETSFLTPILRAYGGDGLFEGYEVARVLKDINFVGFGYVPKPANPDSVIFESGKISNFSFAEVKNHNPFGVYTIREDNKFSRENNQMSDVNIQAKLDEALKANDKLREELAQADVARFESQIDDLKSQIDQLKSDASTQNVKFEQTEAAKACMCNQYEELKAEKEKLQAEFDALSEKQRAESRLKAFKDKGYSDDEAKAQVAKMAGMDDDNFKIVAELIAPKQTERVAPPKFVAEESVDEAEVDTDTEVEAKAEETSVSETTVATTETVATDDKKQSVLVAVAEHFSAKFGTINKEEK